jgi:hypothetical protein
MKRNRNYPDTQNVQYKIARHGFSNREVKLAELGSELTTLYNKRSIVIDEPFVYVHYGMPFCKSADCQPPCGSMYREVAPNGKSFMRGETLDMVCNRVQWLCKQHGVDFRRVLFYELRRRDDARATYDAVFGMM